MGVSPRTREVGMSTQWRSDNAVSLQAQLELPALRGQNMGLRMLLPLSQKTTQAGDPGAHRPLGRLLAGTGPVSEPGGQVPAGRGGA